LHRGEKYHGTGQQQPAAEVGAIIACLVRKIFKKVIKSSLTPRLHCSLSIERRPSSWSAGIRTRFWRVSATTGYITFPVTASLTTQTLESSFILKLHALLCRSYVKGRDWLVSSSPLPFSKGDIFAQNIVTSSVAVYAHT
jgi:hypothetical protein